MESLEDTPWTLEVEAKDRVLKGHSSLCPQHTWEWRRWAGTIDRDGNPSHGWSPDNVIPAGVTAKLALEQRLSIRTSCTRQVGCSEHYGPRPTS